MSEAPKEGGQFFVLIFLGVLWWSGVHYILHAARHVTTWARPRCVSSFDDGFLTSVLIAAGPWTSVASVWFISLVQICLNEFMPSCALWRSLIWTGCPSLSPVPQPVHMPLDNLTPMSCLPNVPLVCFLVVSLTVIKVSPHSPGKLTGRVNPKAANHLWRNSQGLLTRMPLSLPGQFLWLPSPSWGQCQGPLKTSCPAVCLRQDVPLVSVQISKSWFHLIQPIERVKNVLDFSCTSRLVLLHSQTGTVQEALIREIPDDGQHYSMLRVCLHEHQPC